jgi:hypothetical protein
MTDRVDNFDPAGRANHLMTEQPDSEPSLHQRRAESQADLLGCIDHKPLSHAERVAQRIKKMLSQIS